MSNKKVEARERVKAMREEQARKERRREQLIRFGVVAAVIVAVVIIGVAVMASRSGDDVDTAAALPAGVTEPGGAVPAAALADGVPTVEVWFDFSCPHCATFEAGNGPFLKQLADEGAANLTYRPVTFVGQAASVRATNAWACALDEGMGEEYMDALYAQQGSYGNRELVSAGESIGLTSSEFRSCVNGSTYEGWVQSSHAVGVGDYGVSGTPTIFVVDGDDRTLVENAQWSPQGLLAAVEAAGGSAPDGDSGEDADDAADEDDE
ncbi:MAG TPA: thioredoxin domain-containing protein [Jiangellaceae bacterium]|nr:thioredoxin domain-containing protein [Jiangellaceae bacterium]